jgi:hypothetical protein
MGATNMTARVAGALYLIIIVAGIFAEFGVRSSLIVSGDAAATASTILAAEGLFRSGMAADLVMILADVALALLFYVLLKPVSQALALLAAFFRLAQAAVLGINVLNLFVALQLVRGADYLAAFSTEQMHALALLVLNAHGMGYALALVFFGLQCAILGYLVFRSGYIPRLLGVLLIIAGVGYLTDSFARVLMSGYSDYEALFTLIVFLPAFIGELSLCLWLLVKGVSIPQHDTSIAAQTTPAEGTAA